MGQDFCNQYVRRKEVVFLILKDFVGAGGPEGCRSKLKHLPLFKHRFCLNSVVADKKAELQVGASYKRACLCKHM